MQAESPPVQDKTGQLYFVEMFLRQRAGYEILLAMDALILRDDISIEGKNAQIQAIVQGVLNGRQ